MTSLRSATSVGNANEKQCDLEKYIDELYAWHWNRVLILIFKSRN